METDEMRNPRRQGQGLVLVITSFLFSLIIAPHVAPAVLGEVLVSPDEIEKASNLSTSTTETKVRTTINADENGSRLGVDFNRVIIINFDDSYKSQFTYANPILDRYGFKATFFEVCDWIDSDSEDNKMMTWNDITELYKEGHGVEAHTMSHPHLDKLSSSELEYEISQSKRCLLDHEINSTIFAYPYGEGWDNPEVVNVVSKYFDLARANSNTPLTFLNCGDTIAEYTPTQPSCSTYPDNDTLVGRYAINSWSHRHIEGDYSTTDQRCEGICTYYNNSQMFEKFIEHVNSQNKYNTDGKIVAIPIVVYHTIVSYSDLTISKRPVDITVNLFEEEMKYLHDNGFNVLLMSDLVYNKM
jgi:peptidoglycan/xylan/chitin deacetylase (PgdA/CDA1 family)